MQNSLYKWITAEGLERRQRLRVRRFFMSLASYAMWYAIAVAGWKAGLLDVTARNAVLMGCGILASQFVFYVLIRSNANLALRDPSMTMAQIAVALAWALMLVAVSREIRGVMLMVYMIALLFGIFALDQRRFLVTGALAYGGYIALVIFERARGLDFFSDGFYIISVVVLGCVLLWTSMFGSYVSNLRYKLQVRNEKLESVLQRMQELADRDDLTGLFNRRVIMESLRKLKARADRTFEPFSVCIIDLDDFKNINDRYGHLTGDRVLVDFSAAMSKELREMDLVAKSDLSFGRYGGEEFILLLPATGLEGARTCAERLRRRQEECRHGGQGGEPCCTLSAGVAEYIPGEALESLLRRADYALYAAKHEGRNRVRASRT